LHIFDNDELADCCVFNCAEELVVEGGEIIINDNLPYCNSLEEIEANCGSCVQEVSCEESITFNSQAEIDDFLYNGCGTVNGDVQISGSDIESLAGLQNLHTINGSLKIWNNDLLINLQGLENLQHVGDSLWIRINPSLITMNGLQNLQSVHSIRIEYNQRLASIFNTSWDINAELEGTLYIAFNKALDFVPLNTFTSIGERLILRDCPCTNVSASSLMTIGGGLLIRGTTNLSNIDNFSNINTLDFLHLYDNDALSDCCVFSCWETIVPSNDIIVNDNLPNCNSTEDIDENCTCP